MGRGRAQEDPRPLVRLRRWEEEPSAGGRWQKHNSWGPQGTCLALGRRVNGLGRLGRAGTGRSPRGTKGLGVARASAEAPQWVLSHGPLVARGGGGGKVTRGHALSSDAGSLRAACSLADSVPIHLSSHLSQRLAQKEGERQPGSRMEGEGGLTSPERPVPRPSSQPASPAPSSPGAALIRNGLSDPGWSLHPESVPSTPVPRAPAEPAPGLSSQRAGR